MAIRLKGKEPWNCEYIEPGPFNTHFAVRPLGIGPTYRLPSAIVFGGLLGFFNLNVLHEQLFFEDGKIPDNIGFFPQGRPRPDSLGSFGYIPKPGKYDDCFMRLAVEQTLPGGYNLLCNNCQHWADAVRIKYFLLLNDTAAKLKCYCTPK